MPNPMTPAQFIAKWSPVTLSERAASQEHFIDLCRLLGQPTPAEHDATGNEYTFEKGVAVSAPASQGSRGDRGFADVWWRGKFAWEYKTRDKYASLSDAYRQLLQYREALENPPLLVVCDISRTEIHTNFTGTKKEIHSIALSDLDKPEQLDLLRRVFADPDSFKPTLTTARVTEAAAACFAQIADTLRERHRDPHAVAHFLMKCMFCLFAEDVGLLPPELFTKLLRKLKHDSANLVRRLNELFGLMARGGEYGTDDIKCFNGGLFDAAPALELKAPEVAAMLKAAGEDWASVEPAIFGTLFERTLDPGKRAQIGAHYTSRDDIMLIVEPVVMAPLRREWESVKVRVEEELVKRRGAPTKAAKAKADEGIESLLRDFQIRLGSVRILDPACGSGNFLYVAIQRLLDLEKEVVALAMRRDIGINLALRCVRPTQLHGIEINAYAAELAQVVIWIGYLQWLRDNGAGEPPIPILDPLQTIECRDAILASIDPPLPAKWPEADFIIGNPPFLGSKVFRQNGLDEPYIQAMFAAYDLPKTSDLCCYWFELGWRAVERRPAMRVGLLATQGIRGGDNRTVLERIKQTGDIFMAWSDREWVLDGAAVHVSMVGFDGGHDASRELDGRHVRAINADLSTASDLTSAAVLAENKSVIWSIGTQKGGSFDLDWTAARALLSEPNPDGRSNVEVVRPWANALDAVRRPRGMWIIEFGPDRSIEDAAKYAAPFEYVRRRVEPERSANRRDTYRLRWWIHQEARATARGAVDADLKLVTPRVAKHRLWLKPPPGLLPDCQLIVFARSDDYFFGVLHSAVHELWALRMGTQLEDRPRYTPTSCFETFPLPWPPGEEPKKNAQHRAIAEAARELDELRERWLNPPEWIDPIAARIDAADDFHDVPEAARPLIRRSAIMAEAAKDQQLKKRTLTNLYNERPTWLRLAHEKLDRAVLAAYAAVDPAGGWKEEWAEVWAETGAGRPLPGGHALTARRGEVDEAVLANLLRMNRERTGD